MTNQDAKTWIENAREAKALANLRWPVTFTRPSTYQLSPQFLSDILVTAVEGGINYWARVAEPVFAPHPDNRHNRLLVAVKVTDVDGGRDFQRLDLTLKEIHQGIASLFDVNSDTAYAARPDIVESVRLAVETGQDAGEIDAEGADVIVQVALFGEVVYG
jgi:hypothetical protein